MIPKQLKEMRFNRVMFGQKNAFEKGWQNNPYSYKEIQEHFPKDNYGVLCGKELRVLDDDSKDKRLMLLFVNNFGMTFQVRDHLYFRFDNSEDKKIIFHGAGEHLGELQGEGTYVVGCGSTHPDGTKYERRNDLDIITISYEKFIKVFDKYITGIIEKKEKVETDFKDDKFIQLIKDKWVEGNRQDLAMSLAGYLRKEKRLGIDSCISVVQDICEDVGDTEVNQRIASVRSTYAKDESEVKGYSGLMEKDIKIKEKTAGIFTREAQVEQFWKDNPFFYDKSKMFFIWRKDLFKYELADIVDLLNVISDELGLDTINSKVRGELTAGFEQVGRRHIPKTAPLSWIQFKNKIYDFKTNEEFESTPEYFITNPLPYNVGNSIETPTIDKLFSEWVGDDWSQTLYEIIAYTCSSDQFLQRLVALHGGGSNGKGTFIKLIKRLLGKENICTSELKELAGSGFETASIYKKLACFMGEVSYEDLKNTNQIKKLSGEDDIRFCFKGKTPFTDLSITTLLSATNSMPRTPDKTIGFYRKWLIVDFPNQFDLIKKDLINNIPEEEFENLSFKVIGILKDLYKTQKFHKEGSFEERMIRYEDRSNPIQKFVETHCQEIIGERIELREFANAFNEYAKINHLRIISVRQISKMLKEDGFELGIRSINVGNSKSSKYFILNLSLIPSVKTNETNETNESAKRFLRVKSVDHSVSSVSSVSFPQETEVFNDK